MSVGTTTYPMLVTFGGLTSLLSREPVLSHVVEDALTRRTPTLDLQVAASARPAVAAVLGRSLDGSGRLPVLLVTSTFREAEESVATLKTWLGADAVCYYPSWETLPHERLSPRTDTVGRRMEVLRRLCGTEGEVPQVVVAPVRSLLQPQVAGLGRVAPVRLAVGEEHDLTELATELVNAAYSRVDMVERRGEFAVRGGIVDVFPPVLEHPVRIDFFGDEIEEMTSFAVADQRSTDETHQELICAPCRELILTDEVRSRAKALLTDHPELADMLERIGNGQAVEGMEALMPALVDEMELLVDVLPEHAMVVLSDPEMVHSRAADLVRTSEEFLGAGWAAVAGGGQAPIDLAASGYRSLAQVRSHCLERGMAWWSMSSFSLDSSATDVLVDDDITSAPQTVNPQLVAVEPWHGDVEAAVKDLTARLDDGWTVLLCAEGEGLSLIHI